MIVIRFLSVIGVLYLSWLVLPTIIELVLYPFIAGGKNTWIFDASKWIALFIGVLISGYFWENFETNKRLNFIVLIVVSLAIVGLHASRYSKAQARIMGYEPTEAAKNVILKFDSQADINGYKIEEIKRYKPENKSDTIVFGGRN